MARRHVAQKRSVLPDPKYKNEVVTKFVNCMMNQGKKAAAEKAFYGEMDIIGEQGQDPLEIFNQALDNSRPLLEVKSRRVGGSNYQVPVEVSGFRATNLALRWIIRYAHQRVGRSMAIKLANEIIDTANDIGNTIKKKEETHKMAEANKAFAHFRY